MYNWVGRGCMGGEEIRGKESVGLGLGAEVCG